jgi:hypothetical protein
LFWRRKGRKKKKKKRTPHLLSWKLEKEKSYLFTFLFENFSKKEEKKFNPLSSYFTSFSANFTQQNKKQKQACLDILHLFTPSRGPTPLPA